MNVDGRAAGFGPRGDVVGCFGGGEHPHFGGELPLEEPGGRLQGLRISHGWR